LWLVEARKCDSATAGESDSATTPAKVGLRAKAAGSAKE